MPPLTPDEWSELKLSVGTHHKRRVLRPMEVAKRMQRILESGVSPQAEPYTMDQLARGLDLRGGSMVPRFLSLLEVPEEFQGMIEWGVGAGELDHLTFSIAMTVAPLNPEHKREILTKILKHELNKRETMMAVQALRRDPSRSVSDAIAVALTTRPVKIDHEILIGSFSPESPMSRSDIPIGRKEAMISAALRPILEGEPLAARVSEKHFVLSTSPKGKRLLHDHGARLGMDENQLVAKLCEARLAS